MQKGIAEKNYMVTDVQVVERLRAKDPQAYRLLIERLEQPIIGYLHRLVGDREVARELAQDTFIQVYKEIGKTSQELALDAWIYRIATNYALRHLNRKRKWQIIGFSTREEYDANLMVEGPEEQAEIRMLVGQALAKMKPEDALCLRLHYGEGYSYDDIANYMSMSSEAVRKRIARGVEKFRTIYETPPLQRRK